MSKNEKKNLSGKVEGPLDTFEPGGESGPIEDRNEYERYVQRTQARLKVLGQ